MKKMLTVLTKKIALILLLGLLSASVTHAEIRNYQYDGKLPFVQMMLNMMVAMGILDRVPVNGIYNARNMYSPYGMSKNQYRNRRLANSVWGGNTWGNNAWRNNTWGNNSWNNALGDTAWGQPRWGVLPEDSYSLNNYQNNYPSTMSGWVNEPWETSVWNNKKQTADVVGHRRQNIVNQTDNYAGKNQVTGQMPKVKQPEIKQPEIKQKACVTDFCGMQAPSLNGLWVTREGEMLGVKNGSYLWSDGKSRHLTGNIKLQSDYFLASADGYDQLMRFKYKLDGNYLLTMQPDGLVREFKRVSNRQSY